MKNSKQQVSRFLMQATLGADQKLIDKVSDIGIEKWLQSELESRPSYGDTFESSTNDIWRYFRSRLLKAHGQRAIDGDGNNPALPYKWYFHMGWWQNTLEAQSHLLRHRVALALSEILVISDNSVLELDAIGMASYYDLLYKHAFGNYADLLFDVSMHPCMGVYLSHMNNRKADPAKHIHPDENYAREIMQLFSIGLYQLNPDGSKKRDANGKSIPTYDNRDIKELARVFTGLKADSYQFEWENSFWQKEFNGYEVSFEDGIEKRFKTIPFVNMTKPMSIDESYHDRLEKSLLNGHIKLRSHTSGEEEIRVVTDKLVSYPSTAPFIATKLINQLVTSNPSPEYVEAVAKAFGSRGDLKAAVKEILIFPLKNPVGKKRFIASKKADGKLVQSQKLKSPILRVTQLLRAFNASNQSDKLWLIGDDIQDQLQQHPLSSPTVFNFYKPNFVPHGAIEESKLVAPEFELHNTATSIAYVNNMYYWLFGGYLPAVSTEINSQPDIQNVPELDVDILQRNGSDKLSLDLSAYISKAENKANHPRLIDELSLLLTGNEQLSIKPQILSSFAAYDDNPEWVVQTIVFFIAISPEFTVQEA
ncbi:DUF1800 family protein [Vibrio sp. HN007]|uniref:DUF1800 domain-containing protein n=1 Tax=Vibrio iocasae TaxID=3098914 RepID=UPI0035D48057